MIRILLVDDSPLALYVLKHLLDRSPDIRVTGTATNGREALELLPALNPDLICTDLHMPVMDGLEFTREVMSKHPYPILVVSVSVEPGSPNVFQLLEAGAVDVYAKPRAILEVDQERLARELASKIRIVAGVHVFRTPRATRRVSLPPVLQSLLTHRTAVKIVAVGASTGGPQGLRKILSALPAGFPLPVVCVQHIGADFLPEMIRWLGEACPLPVRTAVQGELPQGGVVYFAPDNAHLEFDDHGRFLLSDDPPCDGHRPSATVTLRAAARCFGAHTVGVLLSGMGRDGATGMAEIAAAGGITIAQDEESCVVYGMPRAAVSLGAVQHVLSIEQISPALVALANNCNGTGGES